MEDRAIELRAEEARKRREENNKKFEVWVYRPGEAPRKTMNINSNKAYTLDIAALKARELDASLGGGARHFVKEVS